MIPLPSRLRAVRLHAIPEYIHTVLVLTEVSATAEKQQDPNATVVNLRPALLPKIPNTTMIDSATLLRDYGVSAATGFLPHSAPLRHLPDPYYAPWEDAVRALPQSIGNGSVHSTIRQLPLLETNRLSTEAQWQRACVILTFLTQAWTWSGQEPEDVWPTTQLEIL